MLIALPATADQVFITGPSDLTCNIGPVSKTYGDTTWLVYACTDGHSLTIVSAPDSKALPFLFIFHWEDGQYQLSGTGTGDKAVTDAAFRELKAFTASDIEHLLAEATASVSQH